MPKLNGGWPGGAAKGNQVGLGVSSSFTPPGQSPAERILDFIGNRAPALYFAILNLPRYVRYWPGGSCCESCGLYTPLSRLSWPRFRNGQRLPVCVECDDFHVLVQDMAETGVFGEIAA